MADAHDLCPDTPGSWGNAGCPDSRSGDRDGDGLSDDIDLCPDEAGLPEHAGCPPPGMGEDSDGDGIPDEEEAPTDPLSDWDLEPLFPDDFFHVTNIEFQALEFQLNEDYDSITCYAGIGSLGMNRFGPFELEGERRWDLSSQYGGENHLILLTRVDEPLEVRATCGAEVIGGLSPEGSEGTYYDLGSISQLHPPPYWDGHVITVNSSGSPDGRFFQAKYRLCQPSCEQTSLPAPTLSLFHMGNDHRLVWYWNGDRSRLAGYKIYLNGSYIMSVVEGTSSLSVGDFAPQCGDQYEFQLSVYDDAGGESALSNIAYWTAEACARSLQISFDSLDVHDPPADEHGLHQPGPIFGEFFGSYGANTQSLPFDACWCYVGPGSTFWGWCEGLKLERGLYAIPTIFDWIQTQMASCIGNGCHSNFFEAPGSNVITIELRPGDDLTIGGRIMDCDSRANTNDTLFQEQETLTIGFSGPNPPPIRHTIAGNYVDLNVTIAILREER